MLNSQANAQFTPVFFFPSAHIDASHYPAGNAPLAPNVAWKSRSLRPRPLLMSHLQSLVARQPGRGSRVAIQRGCPSVRAPLSFPVLTAPATGADTFPKPWLLENSPSVRGWRGSGRPAFSSLSVRFGLPWRSALRPRSSIAGAHYVRAEEGHYFLAHRIAFRPSVG